MDSGRQPWTHVTWTRLAFVTLRGQFRFKVLSFGLANDPNLFQRIMDLVLAGLTCLIYDDDVICFANNFEEHVKCLGPVSYTHLTLPTNREV